MTSRIKSMGENVWLVFLGRMFQLIGVPLIVGLVMWQLNKQDSTHEAVNALSNRITSLETTVRVLSEDPYRGQDAKRDLALRDILIGQNSARIIDHEGRIKALEVISAQRH